MGDSRKKPSWLNRPAKSPLGCAQRSGWKSEPEKEIFPNEFIRSDQGICRKPLKTRKGRTGSPASGQPEDTHYWVDDEEVATQSAELESGEVLGVSKEEFKKLCGR